MDTNLFWVPHPELAYVPASLVPTGNNSFKAKTRDGLEFTYTPDQSAKKTQLLPVHETSLVTQRNLLNLGELTEQALLHQLSLKFKNDDIYSWISTILLSVNPFKYIPGLYDESGMETAFQAAKRFDTDQIPHVFSIGANAYQALMNGIGQYNNQAILISGESGSGKTLANTLLLRFFSNVTKNRENKDATQMSEQISEQIITSNLILESFGNSKTTRNFNSSRFGRYITLYFHQGLIGAQIESFLLEKSRISTPNAAHGERNYHIFYQLLAGLSAEEKKKFSMTGETDQFTMLRGTSIHSDNSQQLLDITGFDDKRDFELTKERLGVHFGANTMDTLFGTLAGILHFSNVEFEDNIGASNDGCRLTESSNGTIDIICGLLGLNKDILVPSLLYQKLQVGKELVQRVKTKTQATQQLAAVVRSLYDSLFGFIIETINKTLVPGNPTNKLPTNTISLLDIFGFEHFDYNGFDQLLINLTNERLQAYFNNYVFEVELAEYKIENLNIENISYINNQPCLDLIENGAKSILVMIDDELKIPKASDETILNKFNERHQYNEYYTKSRTRAPVFSISHYAASVTYTVDNWLAKSKDDISLDTLNCLSLSSVPILRTTMTELLNIRKGPQRSLGVKFKDQLSQLSERLEKSNPFFIRCIKSNEGLSANYFESTFVLNQLKYLGLLSLVQIRKVGYSVRLTYSQFLQRYNLLLIGDSDEAKLTAAGLEQLSPDKQVQLCKQILHRVDQREKDWKLGSSKAFYRSNIQTILEEMRSNELEQQTMYLQAYIKTSLIQHKYQKMINLVNQIEHFLQIYQEKLKTRQLNDITPSKLLPQINPLLLQCQTHNIEPDLQSHKRSVIMATQLTLLKLRLDEQDDAEAFLERALLSNQKDSIQAAIRETQLAFLTPFDGERLEEMIVENNDINFDLFNPTIATLLTNATQLYIALDGYDQLRVKTQNERTLELALSLIKNAQRLGLDKGVVLEAQELYKVIADEVAEKERVRKEALEKERLRKEAEEKEQKRIEDEKKKKKIEEENAKKAEEEKEEEENAKKAQEKAQKDDKSQDFFQNAEKSDSIVVIAPILISPLRPSSSSSSSSSETVNRPDYNKINHFIETSNEPQLRSYLSQFERVIVNNNISRSDHLIDVPLSPHSAYKQGLLNLNSTFLPKIPLYEATLRADMNIINTLIEFGADINITNTTGLTPLSTAIKNGRFGLAETFILEHHAAVSQYDVNEETGNSIGHIMAQALSSLLSKFSTSKSKSFFSLLELVLDINDTVIYCVENNSKHTAIQYFKKILKMGSQQLESQIKALSDKKKNTNSLSQHGVNQSNKDQDKEILKANEALQFLTNVKNVLFDTTTDGVSTPRA